MFGSYEHEGEIGGRGRHERDYNNSYVRVGVRKLGRKDLSNVLESQTNGKKEF